MYKENEEFNEMKKEFEFAINSVTVEKGLKDLDKFKEKYIEAF